MDLMKELQGVLGNGDLLAQLGKSVGADPTRVGQAAQLSIPALLSGLSANAKSEEGAKSLADALDYHASKNSVDLDSLDIEDSSKMLGHIFGDKKSAVAEQLSANSGLSSSQSGGLLAMLAPILMNMLGKEKQSKGFSATDLSDITGSMGKQMGGGSDILGGLTDLLGGADKDKDDNGGLLGGLSGMLGGLFGDK